MFMDIYLEPIFRCVPVQIILNGMCAYPNSCKDNKVVFLLNVHRQCPNYSSLDLAAIDFLFIHSLVYVFIHWGHIFQVNKFCSGIQRQQKNE